MNARPRKRQYPFTGSLEEYVIHLEWRCRQLEADLQQTSTRLAAFSTPQSTAQDSQRLPQKSNRQRPHKRRRENDSDLAPAWLRDHQPTNSSQSRELVTLSTPQSTAQGSQRCLEGFDGTNFVFDIQTQDSQVLPDRQQPRKRHRKDRSDLAPARLRDRHLTNRGHSLEPAPMLEQEGNSLNRQPNIGKKGGEKRIVKDAASVFLAHASGDNKEWALLREATMFSTPDIVIRVYQLFVLRPMNRIQDFNLQGSLHNHMAQRTLPAILSAYETIHEFLLRQSRLASQLCNFGDLVCYCICAVARGNGATIEQVDKLQNVLLPRRSQNSRTAYLMRRVAVWTASLIDALEADLGYRASHLFVMCGPSMTAYRRWSRKGFSVADPTSASSADQDFADGGSYDNDFADETSTDGDFAQEDDAHRRSIQAATRHIKKGFKKFEEKVPEGLKISFSPASIIASLKLWTPDQINKSLATNLTPERYEQNCRIHDNLAAEYQHGHERWDPLWQRQETGQSGKNCKGRSQSNGDTESPEDSSAESISHTGSLDSRQKSGSYSESSESDFDETQCSSPSDDSNRRSSSQVPRPVDNQPNEPVPQLVPHNGHSDISACARLAILAAVANDKDGYQAEEVAGHGSPSQIQSRSTSIEPPTTMPLLRGSYVVHEQIEDNTPVIRPSKTAIGLGNGTRPAFVESGFVSSGKEHFSYAGLREDVFMGNEHDGPDVVDFGQFSCSGEVPC